MTLAETLKLASELIEKEKNLETRDALFSKKLDHLIWLINESEPGLVPSSVATSAHNDLQNAIINFDNEESRRASVDEALRVLGGPWNKMRSKPESSRVIKELETEAKFVLERLRNEAEDLRGQIEFRASALATLDEQLQVTKDRIDTEAQRLDTLVTTEQEALNTKKQQIDVSNSEFLENAKSKIVAENEELLQELLGEIQSRLERVKATEKESSLNARKIEQHLGLSAEKILTKDYSDITTEERSPQKWWNFISILCFLMVPAFSVLIFFTIELPQTWTLVGLLARIVPGSSFLIPAIFAASKASKHREAQLRARRTHVRLTTLEPFLAKFNENERGELRKSLLDEFFKEKPIQTEREPIFFGISLRKAAELFGEQG